MNDKKIRQIVRENNDPYRLVEALLNELGLSREFEMRETKTRTNISISSKRMTPHERWVSDWKDMT